jgi:SAM-dependent methyltransferase
MNERESWGDFYADAGGTDYLLDHVAIHKDFLKQVLAKEPQSALEAGCGSAIMSVFLAMTGIRVTACDRDEKVLKNAADNAKRWKTAVQFCKEDILKFGFKDGSFDIVFSQGVLEHLNDDEIRQAAKEALRVGKHFIFSVPGPYYKHRDFGDERLLPGAHWKKLMDGVGKFELESYYHIRTKRNFLLKRPLMLMGILTQ